MDRYRIRSFLAGEGTWKRKFILLSIGLAVSIYIYHNGSASEQVTVDFLGAAREVGGSCHLVTAGGTRFLVDCGALGSAGEEGLPGDAASLSFVLLTHAHSDHCGLIPRLCERGFAGPVFCTRATAEITPIMLKMGRGFSRRKVSKTSFERAIESLTPVPFDTIMERGPVSFRFRRAGHLIGAGFIEIWIASHPDTVKVVFSGDIGSGSSLLIPPPETCEKADYVIIESTYGSTVREKKPLLKEYPGDQEGKGPLTGRGNTGSDLPGGHDEFARAIARTLEEGGDVLVPAFTLGRTQEVIAAIDLYCSYGIIPRGTLVYTDSPTAEKISDIYRSRIDDLSSWARSFYHGEVLRSENLREVRSKTSLKVHARRHAPAIFISSSGDLDHANSPRHLAAMFDDPENLVCIVGWQPPSSAGRRLLDGADPLLLKYSSGRTHREEWISPALRVMRFSSFSAHADQDQLVSWLSGIDGVRKVFLVHGEYESAASLSKRIEKELGIDTVIPRRGDKAILPGPAKDHDSPAAAAERPVSRRSGYGGTS
ncbi:MAG: MBL fold metallo-hydrolase [Candidatus Krumholzibacteriota bacterium]|nr:MBL fold metallo-hydrolase [Candidatus Krumholzibacteriota bacterium]